MPWKSASTPNSLPPKKRVSPSATFDRFRSSRVPAGGWTWESFNTPNGVALLRDLLKIRRLAYREGSKRLMGDLEEMFRSEFSLVLGQFIAGCLMDHDIKARRKPDLVTLKFEFDVPNKYASTFQKALNKAFTKKKIEARVTKSIRPAAMSTMDHVYRKSVKVLGGEPTQRQLNELKARADGLCRLVTRVSDTTKWRMRKEFQYALDNNMTMGETVNHLMGKFRSISSSRIPTIVRTELGRAMDIATIKSFKDAGNITHVSVIGCEAIEFGIPEYNGVPTCNIRNVPLDDADTLEFHINHTGSIIPTGFRTATGRVPIRRLGTARPIGHPDNRRAARYTDPYKVVMGDVYKPSPYAPIPKAVPWVAPGY